MKGTLFNLHYLLVNQRFLCRAHSKSAGFFAATGTRETTTARRQAAKPRKPPGHEVQGQGRFDHLGIRGGPGTDGIDEEKAGGGGLFPWTNVVVHNLWCDRNGRPLAVGLWEPCQMAILWLLNGGY